MKRLSPHTPSSSEIAALVIAWVLVLACAAAWADLTTLLLGVCAAGAATGLTLWPRAEPKAKPGELRCRFCGKSQRDVAKLIAGPDDLCICDECVRLSADIVDDVSDEERAERVMQVALTRLQPPAKAARLVDAWAALAPDAEARLRAARYARVGGNFGAALRALEGVADEGRSARHHLEAAALRLVELEEEGAGALVEGVAASELPEEEAIEHAVLRAFAGLEDAGAAERGERAARARAAVAKLEGVGWAATRARALSDLIDARLAISRGDLASAEASARAAVAIQQTAHGHEVLGEILAARGDHAGAHEARARALQVCDPESPRGRRLTLSSVGPFR